MAKSFKNLKTAIGLDDIIGFGIHQGYTVSEVIKDRPEYIDWLMRRTNTKFYDSVYEEMDRVMPELPKNTNINIPVWFGASYDQRGFSDFEDWYDDIPF